MMPVFELQTGDGKTFQVDAPDMQTAAQSLGDHVASAPPPRKGIGDYAEAALKPITSIPETYSSLVDQAMARMGRGYEQMKSGKVLSGAGNMALGGLEYASAPINAPARTIVGKPITETAESVGIPRPYAELAGNLAEAGATFALPMRVPRVSRAAEITTPPARMLDVGLSEGQATRNLSLIQREQAAARGASGPPAEKAAQAFLDQQKGEIAGAREKIAKGFDPYNQQIAESAQEAGDVVQRSVQRGAATAKASVDTAYKEARSLPGEIHAGAFEGMAAKIKGDLSLRDEPVIVDSKLTPFASKMIEDLEGRISQLKIENRADPFGQPNPENITGINLAGVDQMRKRLSTMRKDAFASGNAADGRAAKAVLDAFDDRIDQAINGGLFTGDQHAVSAWNTARAAYADYRKTFTKGGAKDAVGGVVEKIIGKGGDNVKTANDVAKYIFGSAGVNPTSLNVGVTSRLKTVLGDKSPEWSAVKQGLFSRLTEAGQGVTDFGPGKVAQRLNRFLNADGKEMAALVYSPAERALVQKYADLMRQIEVPQAGANWSNTAMAMKEGFKPSMTARALNHIGGRIGTVVGNVVGTLAGAAFGGVIGHPLAGMVSGRATAARIESWSGQAMEARLIAKQMPVVTKATQNFAQAAVAAESSPVPRNIARLSLAATNLSNNLKGIHVAMSPDDILKAMQGGAPAPAEQRQPDVVMKPSQP